jgi:hypothetical protein
MAGNVDESGGYTCQECGETLADGDELDSHMESEHPRSGRTARALRSGAQGRLRL